MLNADGRWPSGGKLSHRARELSAFTQSVARDYIHNEMVSERGSL